MKNHWGIPLYVTFSLALVGLLFGSYFAVFPNYTLANNGGYQQDANEFTLPPCSFLPKVGRTIFEFPKSKLKSDNLLIGPVWAPLLVGKYKVSLMSWDGYENRKTDTDQKNEQFYITVRDVHGVDIVSSSITPDLSDDFNSTVFTGVVDNSLDISRDGAKVVAKHAKLYGAYEADPLYAVCAVFDHISSPILVSKTICNDTIDNDGDGKIDTADAACHTDGNASTTSSYDPAINDENSKPIITRLGANPITMFEGDGYIDAGATAFDEEDGIITGRIVRGGPTVTSSTIKGSYTITYDVSDSRNVAASQVTRLVIVQGKLGPSCPQCGGGGAPGPDPLYIINEKIYVFGSSTTAVVITWDTNVSATSRVAFGTTSMKTLTLQENFGYSTSTRLYASTTKSHSVTIENLIPGITYYFRPTSKRDEGTVERTLGIELSFVPGAATSTTATTPSPVMSAASSLTPSSGGTPAVPAGTCFEYIRAFIKFGANNDQVEVLKLQSFLRSFEGAKNVPLSGIYDAATRDALNTFQEKYRDDVLTPWGLKAPTGYVYITTKRHINKIYCSYKLDFALTSAEKAEIDAYRKEIERLRAQGIDVPAAGFGAVSTTTTAKERQKSAGNVEDQILKDKEATSSEDTTTAVIEAFKKTLGDKESVDSSSGTEKEGIIRKIAATITAKIHPSKWIQLLLILILFIVGFLLYRSGGKQENNDEDDDDIPQFGKSNTPLPPIVTPFYQPQSPKNAYDFNQSRETEPQNNSNNESAASKDVGQGGGAQPRITLEQLKDNLVLKREENSAKDSGPEDEVIHL